MSDKVWTWNGYRLCKRKRGALEKDQAASPIYHIAQNTRVFDTELEAVEFAFQEHVKTRDEADKAAHAAQKVVHKWFLRRKKLKEIANAR